MGLGAVDLWVGERKKNTEFGVGPWTAMKRALFCNGIGRWAGHGNPSLCLFFGFCSPSARQKKTRNLVQAQTRTVRFLGFFFPRGR